MKEDYKNLFTQLVFTVAIPLVLLWLGVGLSFLIFPYDMESAFYLVAGLTVVGSLIAMAITIHNIMYYGGKVLEKLKDDSHSDS